MYIANFKKDNGNGITEWEVVSPDGHLILVEVPSDILDDIEYEIAKQLTCTYWIDGTVSSDDVVLAENIETEGNEETTIRKQEVIARLCTYFGCDRFDDLGAYCGNGTWMSMKRIIDIIESCETF